MKALFPARLLLGFAAVVSLAHAQWNYNPPVRVTRLAGPPVSGLADELSAFFVGLVAVDPHGVLYGLNGTEVLTFSPDRTITKRPAFFLAANGDRVPAELNDVRGLAVDAQGNVYVTVYSTTARSVCKIAPDGATVVLAADLKWPVGIAVDPKGDLYVAESGNHVVRKISASGVATVFAGNSGQPGSADGVASARFNALTGVAVDGQGNVWVADCKNSTIRKITPEGVVSTIAGSAGRAGSVDGPGSVARFTDPYSITADSSGAVYVIDGSRYTFRRISPEGIVTTFPVEGGFGGLVEGGFLSTMAVGANGALYFTDGWYGGLLASGAPPSFAAPLARQTAAPGESATFRAVAEGAEPIGFQWLKNGSPISGATHATLTLDTVQAADLGAYSVRATNAIGTVVSHAALLTFSTAASPGLTNLSIRASVGEGAQTLIVGFTIDGASAGGSRPLLVRGVGPTLGALGVAGTLADPLLSFFSGNALVAANDNWNGDAQIAAVGAQVGALPFVSAASRDAALYHAGLRAGAYSVQLSGVGGGRGVALAELYDATPANTAAASGPRLVNVSARTQVGVGADALIAGFTIGGPVARTLLIRAIGPALSRLGVAGALADPKLELFHDAVRLQSNDNWGGVAAVASAAAKVGAFALDAASRDAAFLVTLGPGSYTVQVSGVANASGIALLEIYEVP